MTEDNRQVNVVAELRKTREKWAAADMSLAAGLYDEAGTLRDRVRATAAAEALDTVLTRNGYPGLGRPT